MARHGVHTGPINTLLRLPPGDDIGMVEIEKDQHRILKTD